MSILGTGQKIRRPNLTSVETIDSSGSAWPSKFHPDGDFIAIGGNMTNKGIIVYSWNGTDTLAEVESINIGGSSYGLDWHKDGDFLVATESSDSTNSIVVYSWNGTDTLAAVETIGVTNGCSNIHWHPSGDYLAVATYNTGAGIKVYSWNGTDTLAEVETINTGAAEYGVRWSNDGDYLAVGGPEANKNLKVYSWNGTNTLTEEDVYDANGPLYGPRWTSDGAYIFIPAGSGADYDAYAFYFDGSNLTLKDTLTFGNNSRGLDIFNDRYLAISRTYASASTQEVLSLYKFSKTDEALSYVDGISANAAGVNIPAFDSKGLFIAAPTYNESSVTLRMVKVYG